MEVMVVVVAEVGGMVITLMEAQEVKEQQVLQAQQGILEHKATLEQPEARVARVTSALLGQPEAKEQ